MTRPAFKQLLLLILALFLVACNAQNDNETPTAVAAATATTAADAAAPDAATVEPDAAPTDTPAPEPTPDPLYTGSGDFPWWNDAVFYQIFVRTFNDSDGDGVGDFNGIIEKLDYLNDGDPATTDDLGITGIWLMPVTESDTNHGYHVTDYYNVEQDYGTTEDFQRLVDEAHARGIRIIVDLVLNHTARAHPWFGESIGEDSPRHDWYVWSEENPGYLGPDAQTVWHRGPGGYYYGVFSGEIPDLNLENPDVTAELYAISEFWLTDMNVDGFRLDAIKHLIEDGPLQENRPATHEWLQAYHTFYKGVNPNAFMVGEAWTATREIVNYTGDEVDIAFQFELARDTMTGVNNRVARPVLNAMEDVYDTFPANQYATFLSNHDQTRVMTQLGNKDAKAMLAGSILLTSPGVPFVYYGEELGVAGTKEPTSDDDMRRPMPWAPDEFRAGFTSGIPWRLPPADAATRNVATLSADPDSILNHYRALIHLRNENEALRLGAWAPVISNNNAVYAFLRYTDNQAVLVIINMSTDAAAEYRLELAEGPLGAVSGVNALYGPATDNVPAVNGGGGFDGYLPLDSLPAESTIIIELLP